MSKVSKKKPEIKPAKTAIGSNPPGKAASGSKSKKGSPASGETETTIGKADGNLAKVKAQLARVRKKQPGVTADEARNQAARVMEAAAKGKSDQLVTEDPTRGFVSREEIMERERGPGRPRESWGDLPQYDTMAQASAAVGIPIAALKIAKDNGCPAFKHGRVDLGEFIRWWFNASFDTTDWTKELTKSRALREKIKLDEDEKKIIDFQKVERFLDSLVGQIFFGHLERVSQEWPPALKGLSERDINAVIVGEVERIKHELTQKLETIGKL